ncbi:hypothetical protein [Chromohalobacter israelensis]
MPSDRYNRLAERLGDLRKHLLPAKFSDVGEYDNEDQVAVRALSFRVLAHAEIESYFEERVVEIAKAAIAGWTKKERLCGSLLHLAVFSGREMKMPPESLEAPSESKRKDWPSMLDPTHRLRSCVTDFIRAVTVNNHGIREKNMLAMLLPVGVNYDDLDPVVLADLDSFGKSRGEAAHTSSGLAKVRQGISPEDENSLIERLVEGIRPIDGILDDLLRDASGGGET